MLSVTSKAPKFRDRLTSELGLDKGYFDRIYGTFLLWLCYIKNKSVGKILLVVLKEKRMPFIKIERKQKFSNNILS